MNIIPENKLNYDIEEYSEIQLDVLNELYEVLNEDEFSIIDDIQVDSNMMEIVGTALADKVITLKQLENFIQEECSPCEDLYEVCESQETFDKVVDFIDSNRAKTFTKEDVNKKKESKISER